MGILIFLVCLMASVIGGICGIGGGVIIKPVLDALGVMSVSALQFLSGLTVLGMSAVSVLRSRKSRLLELRTSSALAVGAVLGGIAGSTLFQLLKQAVGSDRTVGSMQAILLGLLTLLTLVYSAYLRRRVPSHHVTGLAACVVIGLLMGALSDRVGKRRAFVCWGYILWGITTAAFALFGNGQVGGDVGLAVTLFVVMDCIMSAIGSTANDSAFSAWVTDVTDVTNRGVVDIVLSIMPILALIVIFAGFDGMTVHGNWTGFFLVLGGLTSAAGVLGLCIFRDSPALRPVQGDTYLRDVLYAFRPANIRANKMIYICFLGMMFSGLAMQLWQPYMISLVEVTLGIDNYILPIGIVVLASAVLSVLAGKAMDRFGKEKFYYPVAILQVLGGLIAYSIKFVGHAMPLLCVGGTCIMAGNLAMAGLFTASSRDYTPAGRAGASQSVKMVIYIMLPMVLASIIDPLIIKAVALEPTAAILAKYPSYAGSYLYPYELFLAAAVSAVFILIPAYFVRRDADRIRREKLAALEK